MDWTQRTVWTKRDAESGRNERGQRAGEEGGGAGRVEVGHPPCADRRLPSRSGGLVAHGAGSLVNFSFIGSKLPQAQGVVLG